MNILFKYFESVCTFDKTTAYHIAPCRQNEKKKIKALTGEIQQQGTSF